LDFSLSIEYYLIKGLCDTLFVMRPPGKPAALEQRRRKAVELLQQGWRIVDVAAAVKSSTSSVKRWREAFQAAGDEGLNSTPNTGRPSRLSDKQKQQLTEILRKGSRASGYPNELWTCSRIADVIRSKFGIEYHVDHIGRLMHHLGWSVQKPERRARERDEAAIATWREREWPRIKKGGSRKS
jgi:transposase